MTNLDEFKDKFYNNDLDYDIFATPRADKFILLGDFNERVVTYLHTWKGVIGPEAVGKCYSNGLLLLRKCAEYDNLTTYTVFRLPNGNRTSWMHPLSKKKLATHRLSQCGKQRAGCQSDKNDAWCRLLDGS